MKRTIRVALLAVTFAVVIAHSSLAQTDWKPAKGPLMTRWAAGVSPRSVLPEYPRPQMVRRNWQNLNGLWDYAIRPRAAKQPEDFDGRILVPFAVESALSGVMKPVGQANRLWYRRPFKAPQLPSDGRLLLHFGAVDWHATVHVNGRQVGEHKGGYTPFTIDITSALQKEGPQELVVSVWDPTNKGFQPRGKQVEAPRGIWYTAVTGIWRTAWLEPVPAAHIRSLKIVPDVDKSVVYVTANTSPAGEGRGVTVRASLGDRIFEARGKSNQAIEVAIKDAQLWSPDHPHLYDLSVSLSGAAGEDAPADKVDSYCGMRKISLGKDKQGHTRLLLNNKPLFHFGPLDQGWWPDGLYTAPADAALRYDVEMTRKLGFNMARKHVKVEPARWYYHCDKLGLMVWQDMPNGDRHIGGSAPDLERTPESADNYRRELREMIDAYHNHPCIVVWVPFNEGWGQFDTHGVLGWIKKYDPSRLVDGPSGWTDRGSGDIHDIHRYPGPAMPELEDDRAAVLGEFGGLGLPLEGHLWWDKRNWGYRTYKTSEELRSNYNLLLQKLRPLYGAGLAGAIYTQTSDVEGEVNGLMTYDRKVVKLDPQVVAPLHRRFYLPPPVIIIKTILPTSEKAAQEWRYTSTQPAEKWYAADFADSSWKKGPGGFGTESTPGTVVRTEWKSKDIWLRRKFQLTTKPSGQLHLRVHHDEDAVVYLNGQKVVTLSGYVADYVDIELPTAARGAIRQGANTIAVHCRQTTGGQYIDVGIVDVVEKPRRAD